MLLQETQDQLADHAPDFALASGFIPAPKREAVQTLFCFYAHLLAILHQARDPMLGEIKLQWWLEVFEGKRAEGEVRSHPLAQQLIEILDAHHLPKHGLADMVDAMTDFLFEAPPEDMRALEFAFGRIHSVLLRYASLILADGQASGPAGLAGPAGVAYGLTLAIQNLALMGRGAHVLIPSSLLDEAGLDVQSFAGRRDADVFRKILRSLLALAEQRLDDFKIEFASLSQPLRPAFAVMGLVAPRLKRMKKAIEAQSFNPDEHMGDTGPLSKTFRLWQTAVWGRV